MRHPPAVNQGASSRADPVWAEYHAEDRRRILPLEVAAAVMACVALIASAWAVSLLSEAHLYRQMSGEGLKFGAVGMLLGVSWVAALVAAVLLLRAAFSSFTHTRRPLVVMAVCLVLAVASATAVSGWVEGHGDRCIGQC